jgi:hypothetical protein
MEKTSILFDKELRETIPNIMIGRGPFFEDFSRD